MIKSIWISLIFFNSYINITLKLQKDKSFENPKQKNKFWCNNIVNSIWVSVKNCVFSWNRVPLLMVKYNQTRTSKKQKLKYFLLNFTKLSDISKLIYYDYADHFFRSVIANFENLYEVLLKNLNNFSLLHFLGQF